MTVSTDLALLRSDSPDSVLTSYHPAIQLARRTFEMCSADGTLLHRDAAADQQAAHCCIGSASPTATTIISFAPQLTVACTSSSLCVDVCTATAIVNVSTIIIVIAVLINLSDCIMCAVVIIIIIIISLISISIIIAVPVIA